MGPRPLSSDSPLPQRLHPWPNPLPSPALLLLPRTAAIPYSSSKPLPHPRPRRSSSSSKRAGDVEALAERCRFCFNIYNSTSTTDPAEACHRLACLDWALFAGFKWPGPAAGGGAVSKRSAGGHGARPHDSLVPSASRPFALPVTDKSSLKEGSMSPQDGRIKDDHYIYVVLQYGEIDLAHMVAQKWKDRDNSNIEIDENWLRFYWQQMLEAVNTIHEEQIVHSDLKPANFLLVRGPLKLIDFGIAKAIMNDTTNIQRDAQVRTLNYMSPEAFMCNEQDSSGNIIKCGRPSDIWSLGCILYQMVYGKTPFADYETFWAKFKVVTDGNHKINYEPVDNPWLIDLMQRCLAWDRNERWRIPQLLQHPFLLPLVPRDLPPIDHDPCRLLMERVRVHWANPEVSRLCSQLHSVIAKVEEEQCSPTTKL